MKFNDLDSKMREKEIFHDIKVIPNVYIIIRVDGHSFSKFTEVHNFEKPFDDCLHKIMVTTTSSLIELFKGLYAYTESDEISILLPKSFDMFNRKVEKIVSISAARAASNVTRETDSVCEFDSRVWVGASKEEVVDYFSWRQADATRNALNGLCFHTLRKEGLSRRAATKALENKTVEFKNELLFQRGINFNDITAWHKRGTGIYFKKIMKEEFNPKENKTVLTERKILKIDENLPMKKQYCEYIMNRLDEEKNENK